MSLLEDAKPTQIVSACVLLKQDTRRDQIMRFWWGVKQEERLHGMLRRETAWVTFEGITFSMAAKQKCS